MKVLLTIASLLPEYGGPARSVSRLAVELEAMGLDVSVWAADESAIVTPLLSADTAVQRLSGNVAAVLDKFGKSGVVHDNGLWWAHNHSIARRAAKRGIRRLVSTRGALEPWARNHKRLKKSLAWWFYQREDLRSANWHHATAPAEANLSLMQLNVPVCVIPNGVDIPKYLRPLGETISLSVNNQRKIALFLGRIYPIKGLLMLVEAWSRVRPTGWVLHVAGPDEAGHRREVESAIDAAGLGQVISFLGSIEGEAKDAVFYNSDLLVLPSHSENFGVVVAEALAHGVPVLATKAAPWAGVLEHGCGWWVDTSVEGIVKGLFAATSVDTAELKLMGAKGRSWVEAEFGWKGVATQFIDIYEKMLRESPAI